MAACTFVMGMAVFLLGIIVSVGFHKEINMKRITLSVLALTLLLGSGIDAMFFDVWHDTNFDGIKDTYLGTVSSYTGGKTAAANYGYYSASAHPINGPNPEAYKSKMYMYEGADGLSFGFFHNVDAGGNAYWNHVGWDFQFRNMTSSIALVDDSPENRGEPGIVALDAYNYNAGWAYSLNTDGGVFKNLSPTAGYWEIVINPYKFGDIQNWSMYSGDGSFIDLWMNPTPLPTGYGADDDYGQRGDNKAFTTIITKHVVPEAGTVLLFGTGLLVFSLVVRRQRKV